MSFRRSAGFVRPSAVVLSIAATVACWFVLSKTSSDAAALVLLPWIAAVLPLAGMSVRVHWPLDFLTVVIVSLCFAGDSRARVVAAGAILFAGIVYVLWEAANEADLVISFATAVVAIPMLVIGLPGELFWNGVIATTGTIVLEKILREQGERGRETRMLTVCSVLLLASVLPVGGVRQALLPLAISAALLTRRFGGTWAVLLAGLAGLASGLWQGLLLSGWAMGLRLQRRQDRSGGDPAFPAWIGAGGAPGLLPPLVFASAGFVRARVTDLIPLGVALLLALVGRPSIAPLILITGSVLVLASGRLERVVKDLTLALPLFGGTFLLVASIGWAGVSKGAFPLAIPVIPAVLIGLLALSPSFGRAAGLLLTTTGLLILTLMPPPLPFGEVTTLQSGESVSFPAPEAAGRAKVLIAASDASDLRGGTRVGEIAVLDESGRGRALPVRTGEIADWGAFRPAFAYRTYNSVPRWSVRRVEGVGAGAWLHGAGVVEIESDQGITGLRITADGGSPDEARRLLVYGVEWERQR